ncbi:MAG: radical SAM protein [Methanothrix sp.]|uniref:radical SAM protein n=1 Tax=Methanothrix sp. TaxID=90426 RepID=UPI0025D8120C|nr:radical SAM protein [Methanothrix sp.]MCQ8902648.1 radical SAM protein [Methanothrix sp.]
MRKIDPKLMMRAVWQLRVRRRPFVLSHTVNTGCNLRCSFCPHWRRRGNEMGYREIKGMLDDAARFGIGAYNAWATEPLLRHELPEILRHARSLGMLTSLVTNGILLSERINDLESLNYLTVSVDGIESLREIRGIDLDEIVDGIVEARRRGIEVLMNCVISNKNLGELTALVKLAKRIDAWISFEPLHEFDEAECDDLKIRDRGRYRSAIGELIDLKSRGAPIINSITYLRMIQEGRPEFRCHAADLILHVSVDGSIYVCRVHDEPLGHVSRGISNVWRESREMRKNISEGCSGCLFFGYVENSLLYSMVPEVMMHYEWM